MIEFVKCGGDAVHRCTFFVDANCGVPRAVGRIHWNRLGRMIFSCDGVNRALGPVQGRLDRPKFRFADAKPVLYALPGD